MKFLLFSVCLSSLPCFSFTSDKSDQLPSPNHDNVTNNPVGQHHEFRDDLRHPHLDLQRYLGPDLGMLLLKLLMKRQSVARKRMISLPAVVSLR